MNRVLVLLLVCGFTLSSQAFQDCEDIQAVAGKLDVYSNGKIFINKQEVKTKKDSQGKESFNVVNSAEMGEMTPVVIGTFNFSVVRNKNNQPIELQSKQEGFGHPMTGLNFIKSGFSDRYIFDFKKDGSCFVKRISINDVVTYDHSLCEDLTRLFQGISKSEAEKCSKVLSEMSSAVVSFKEKIKSEGLQLGRDMKRNPFQEALEFSAECSKNMQGKQQSKESAAPGRRKSSVQ